jgi:membrane-associated protein
VEIAFNVLDARSYLTSFGLAGVWLVLFAETGLLIGLFLPGDSLLFLAGVAASTVGARVAGTALNLPALLAGAPVAAIAGAQFGYFLGRRYGRALFARPKSRVFKPEYATRAEYYFTRYGPAKAVIIARFVPIVRTVLNPVAGVLGMPPGRFAFANTAGGLVWTVGLILLGYGLGSSIPAAAIDTYLLPIVALVIVISLLPIGIELIRNRRSSRKSQNRKS